MRVGDAARQVGTSARMLRYAEQLGLVAPARTAGGYRDYRERDLLAAAAALRLQARYRVTPADIERYGPLLAAAAGRVSAGLGASPPLAEL